MLPRTFLKTNRSGVASQIRFGSCNLFKSHVLISFFPHSGLDGCLSVHPPTTGYFQLFSDCPLFRKSFKAPFTIRISCLVKNVMFLQAHCDSRNSDVRQPCCGHSCNRWSFDTQIAKSLFPPSFIAIFTKRPPINSILRPVIPLHTHTLLFLYPFQYAISFQSSGFLNKCMYTVLAPSSLYGRAHALAPNPLEQRP